MFLGVESLEEHFGPTGITQKETPWIIVNEKSINFWYDIWMKDSPSINKTNPYKEDHTYKMRRFVILSTRQKIGTYKNLKGCLPDDIIDNVKSVLIPINNVEDKLIWKLHLLVIFPLNSYMG